MDEWSREIPWRQGSVIHGDSIQRLGLQSGQENKIAIIASHDCDIAQLPETEPNIEIIIGRYIDQINGAFTNTKNPRKLHIELQTPEGYKSAEFVATAKHNIPKLNFTELEPNHAISIDPETLTVFKRWLGIRYTRSAFPDEFDSRLKNNALDKKIAKALRKHGSIITAIFFDVDDGTEHHRTEPNDIYKLDITILYAENLNPVVAEKAANVAKNEIIEAFKTKLYDNSTQNWTEIELRYCDTVSDEALTYKQSITLKQWRLEHISFAEDPPHPVPIND